MITTKVEQGLVRKLTVIDGHWTLAPWILTTQLWKHTQMFVFNPLKSSYHSITTLTITYVIVLAPTHDTKETQLGILLYDSKTS